MFSIRNTETEKSIRKPHSIRQQGMVLLLVAVILPAAILIMLIESSYKLSVKQQIRDSYHNYVTSLSGIVERHIANTSSIVRVSEDNTEIRKTLRQYGLKKLQPDSQTPQELGEVIDLPYSYRNIFENASVNAVVIYYGQTPMYYSLNTSMETALDRCEDICHVFEGQDFAAGRYVSVEGNPYVYYIQDYRDIEVNKYFGRFVIELTQIPDTHSSAGDQPDSLYGYKVDMDAFQNTHYCVVNDTEVILFCDEVNAVGQLAETYIPRDLAGEGGQLAGKESKKIAEKKDLSAGIAIYVFSDSPLAGEKLLLSVPFVVAMVLIMELVAVLCFMRFFGSLHKETSEYYRVSREYPLSVPSHAGTFEETELLFQIIRERIDDIIVLEKENHSSELKLQKSRVTVLENQINPHFLFNILEQINWRAINAGASDVAVLIENLADMLRDNISFAERSKLTIKEELDFTENYIRLQQNERGGFTYSFNVDQEIITQNYIPKYTIQPIVENSIVHGFADKDTGGYLTVEVWEDDEGILIRVSDNGCGFDPDTVSLEAEGSSLEMNPSSIGNHIALKNIQSRLKMLYGSTYGLSVISTPGVGTIITVSLPFDNGEV